MTAYPVGKFGRVGTFSFYYSHHMTTLEGGITVTDDFGLSELMRILRAHGWTREVEDKKRWHELYPEFDRRFLFVNLGYNLRPTELAGSHGPRPAAEARPSSSASAAKTPPGSVPRWRRSSSSSPSRTSTRRAKVPGSASR